MTFDIFSKRFFAVLLFGCAHTIRKETFTEMHRPRYMQAPDRDVSPLTKVTGFLNAFEILVPLLKRGNIQKRSENDTFTAQVSVGTLWQ